jgi:branched-chain amino acid transport system substrate-binding protein
MRHQKLEKRKEVSIFGILAVVLAGLIWASAGTGPAWAAEQEIVVAHIDGFTGPYAEGGKRAHNGVLLFLEESKGKLGPFKVKLVTRDSELNPAVGVRRLQEVIGNDKPFLVLSGQSSAVQLAMQDIIGKTKGPIFWNYGMDTKITAERGNRYSFRWASSNYPYARGAVPKFFADNPRIKKIITLMPDYAWGYDMMELLEPVLNNLKIEIVKKQFIPVTATDASPFILEAKESGADAYIQLHYGTLFANCIKQSYEFGLTKKMKVYSLHDDFVMLPAVGCEAVQGVTIGDTWYPTMDNEWSKKFVAKYQKKFGSLPDHCAAGLYTVCSIMDKVLQQTGKADPKVVIPALENFGEYEGPTGKERLAGWYHQCEHNLVMMEGRPCSDVKENWNLLKIVGTVGAFPKQGEKRFDFDRRKEPL